jgi:hypothetical protein
LLLVVAARTLGRVDGLLEEIHFQSRSTKQRSDPRLGKYVFDMDTVGGRKPEGES